MKDYKESPLRPLTVKEMDPDDQPRERAAKYGCGVLPTADLWALILRTGLVGKPITELCRDIMHNCDGSLFLLERQNRKQLMSVKGIGLTKALQIEAVMELIRRYAGERAKNLKQIKSSIDIFELMRHEIGNLPHEEIWALYLNQKNEVIGRMKITQGSAVASVFDLKKIIKEALMRDAQGVALCHNHPSGNLIPSLPDDRITKSLKEACSAMDLRLLDHVIVTNSGYYSYRDSSRL